MKYPTTEEVNQATRFQICGWYRFLPSPDFEGIYAIEQRKIMDRICERFKILGGFTPEISKRLGW